MQELQWGQEGSTQMVASLVPGAALSPLPCPLLPPAALHRRPYSISLGKNGQNYCSLQD